MGHHVDVPGASPDGVAHFDATFIHDSGVGAEQVDRPECALSCFHQALYRGLAGHVRAHSQCVPTGGGDPGCHPLSVVFVEVADYHSSCAGGGHALCHRGTDAVARAGQHDNLVCDVHEWLLVV